jgi:hypothetical protein
VKRQVLRRIDKCEDFFSDMTFLVYCYVLCVVLCKWPDESIGKIFRLRGPYGESAAPSPLLGELNWNSLKIKKKKKDAPVFIHSSEHSVLAAIGLSPEAPSAPDSSADELPDLSPRDMRSRKRDNRR